MKKINLEKATIMKRQLKILISIVLIILLIIFLYFQNNSIQLNKIDVMMSDVPSSFEGFKILHISDLHSKKFGENQEKILKKIKECKPDIIVVTGDMVDIRKYDENAVINLFIKIDELTPIYLVTGNHEYWSGEFFSFEKRLNRVGVTVLRNEINTINEGEDSINIIGVDDKSFFNDIQYEKILRSLDNNIESDEFSILLSHRPDINTYSKYNYDLVFSGHAHGGQIVFPFIGGLYAPNQGMMPKYTSGPHKLNNTTMIISRGLGNSVFPQRIFNRPELILVTLYNKNK